MATRIQLRRGTGAEWTAANPMLAAGEIGVELDTFRFKIGDGATNWDDLDYGGLHGIANAEAPIDYDPDTLTVSIPDAAVDLAKLATPVVPIQAAAPDPAEFVGWLDSSTVPPVLRVWDGAAWIDPIESYFLIFGG